MAKVYFFNNGEYGHVNPTLGLVAHLVTRGEEVIYYTTEEFKETIEQTGATFRTYPVAAPQDFATGPAHIATNFLRYSALLLPHLVQTAERERPDYILFDMFRIWGLHLARYLNIPAIGFSPSFIINSSVVQEIAPHFLHLLENTKSPDGSIDYREQYAQIAAGIKDQYNVDTPDMFDTFPVLGDITLVSTMESFQPAADLLDDSVKYIGLNIEARPAEGDFPIEGLREQPVIFISLGTIFNNKLDFYQNCLAAFANTDYTVVMAIGNQVPVEALGDLPDNFIVRNFVPQVEVLQHTDVFIVHGGMGSVHEALYFGVPMILYPQMFEQGIVAGQVVHFGAGVQLQDTTVETLRESVRQVLNDLQYKHNAEKLGKEVRQLSPGDAADLVQNYVRERNMSSPVSG